MIRDEAALKCARELLNILIAEWPAELRQKTVNSAADYIKNCVRVDELAQEVERKESVLKLLGGK